MLFCLFFSPLLLYLLLFLFLLLLLFLLLFLFLSSLIFILLKSFSYSKSYSTTARDCKQGVGSLIVFKAFSRDTKGFHRMHSMTPPSSLEGSVEKSKW